MPADLSTFVHILLFRCRNCHKPLAIPAMTEEANHERTDHNDWRVDCSCGRSESRAGAEALRHWVIEWPSPQHSLG